MTTNKKSLPNNRDLILEDIKKVDQIIEHQAPEILEVYRSMMFEITNYINYASTIEDLFIALYKSSRIYKVMGNTKEFKWEQEELQNRFETINKYIGEVEEVTKLLQDQRKLEELYKEMLSRVTVGLYKESLAKAYPIEPKRKLSQAEILKQPFDVMVHKDNFINYLEVIIHPNGEIEYATPSHNVKLFMIWYNKRYGVELENNQEMFELKREKEATEVPREWWLNMIQFYVNETGCLSVWNTSYTAPKQGLTPEQIRSLRILHHYDLFKGKIE